MPSEHQLLVFWCQLLALVFAARALGALMRRYGQPAVVGELAAGLLLGPSVLGKLAPGIQLWLFPPDPVQRSLLGGLAWIGVFLLLVLTGLETDLALIRRLGSATARVAMGSLLLPVAAGIALGLALPEVFVGDAVSRNVFALFMGTALSLSALPVIAKILSDLDLMRRNVAQALIAAAMVDDVAGWILLGIVAGLAQSGAVDVSRLMLTIGGLVVFFVLAFSVGQRAVDALLRALRVRATEHGGDAHGDAAGRPRRGASSPMRSGSRRCSAPSSAGSCWAARASTTPRSRRTSRAPPSASSRRSSSPPPACASISACSRIPRWRSGAPWWWWWRRYRSSAARCSAAGSLGS